MADEEVLKRIEERLTRLEAAAAAGQPGVGGIAAPGGTVADPPPWGGGGWGGGGTIVTRPPWIAIHRLGAEDGAVVEPSQRAPLGP